MAEVLPMRPNEQRLTARARKHVPSTIHSVCIRAASPAAACWKKAMLVSHAEPSSGGERQYISVTPATTKACIVCHGAMPACSCVAEIPNSFCLVPCQIWKTAVVSTAERPKTMPIGRNCTSVTVATPTPARRISREIFTFGVVDTL